MKRLALATLAVAFLGIVPAHAQLGSATGGQAASQSSLGGGLCLTSPVTLSNGQQRALLVDCTTGALITEGGGSGGSSNVFIADPTTPANKANVTCDGTSNFCKLTVEVVGADGTILNPGSSSTVTGPNASGTAQGAAPLPGGGTGHTATPTAVADGQAVATDLDSLGKQITSPFAPWNLWKRGTASATGTGATTIIAAQGAAIKIYVTGVQCFRDDAGMTAIHVTLDDTEDTGSGTYVGVANSGGGGGNNPPYATPLVVAANTALTFTSSNSITTVTCNAQGFIGP